MDKEFFRSYLINFCKLASPTNKLINSLTQVKEKILKANRNGKKIIIVGNGGSGSIASHFSVDLTKNAGIRCVNFNEPVLITCFANDYGYERWVEKAIEFYGDKGDIFIAISSSGQSKNILNGCLAAREKKLSAVITFSGFDSDNPLRKLGDINLWVDSRAYNFVENIHQLWLLAVVDSIIGQREYSA